MGDLSVGNLNKSFNIGQRGGGGQKLAVFRNLSMKVSDKEFVSLIGPSGCGKSTLLNMVAGLISKDEGEILLNGRPVKGPDLDRGVVFQEASLFPWLNIRNNVEFGVRSKGLPAAERKTIVDKYVRLVGLSDFFGYFPHQLSGGMRQRVGIARALAIDPEILLMDEPFGALDAQTREDMQSALSDIWQRTHKTVLFVTHDIREAIFLSDRIIVLGKCPQGIIQDLKVDLPRPRDRRSSGFHELEDRLDLAIRSGTEALAENGTMR